MDKLIYLYGLIPTEEAVEKPVPEFPGLDDTEKAFTIELNGISAIVCSLDSHSYSEEQLKEKMNNNMQWLQEKAMHHHETLLLLQKNYTVVPMKFCTIYKNKESLEQSILNNKQKINDSFAQITGKEEWNVKIYCDSTKYKEFIAAHNSTIDSKKEEISKLPPGKQFFEKRKIEKLIDKEIENEKNKKCDSIHERLQQFSIQNTIKQNWSKEVTGKQHDMCWNSVYLLPSQNVDDFIKEIEHCKAELEDSGWRFEATGPWPAYHFAN
jgi:hypothetical protein